MHLHVYRRSRLLIRYRNVSPSGFICVHIFPKNPALVLEIRIPTSNGWLQWGWRQGVRGRNPEMLMLSELGRGRELDAWRQDKPEPEGPQWVQWMAQGKAPDTWLCRAPSFLILVQCFQAQSAEEASVWEDPSSFSILCQLLPQFIPSAWNHSWKGRFP